MGEYKLNKQDFLKTVIQSCMRTSKRGQQDLERVCNGYRTLINNQKKKTPDAEQMNEQLLEILDKAYRMFSDPEFVQIIVDNNVTYQQFIMKYGEVLLGDNKRKYDMSDRFDPSMIAYQDEKRQTRKVKYMPDVGTEYRYLDAEGKEVTIQEIGRLYFEEWNGLKNSISKYRVSKQITDSVYQEDDIFSNIKIIAMGNPQYREAVLEELLSENNIQLSKVGGYVGEIIDMPTTDPNFAIGSETTIGTDYFYRMSPKYALTYKSEELAAVIIQRQIEQQQQKASQSGKITYIGDRKKSIQEQQYFDRKTSNGTRNERE